VKSFHIVTLAALAMAGLCGVATQAAATEAQPSIQIVTALYGRPGVQRQLNFSTRLQQTCGDAATNCQAFCSDAFLGKPHVGPHLPFSSPPICRVVYRCGAEATQTAEADRNEIIDLDCRR